MLIRNISHRPQLIISTAKVLACLAATFSTINEAQKNRISSSLLQWSDPKHYTPPAPHEQQCLDTNLSDGMFVTHEGRSQKSEVAAGLPHRRLEHGAFADNIGSQKVSQPRALRGVLPLTNPNLPCSMLSCPSQSAQQSCL